jgi:hypothetical protein
LRAWAEQRVSSGRSLVLRARLAAEPGR